MLAPGQPDLTILHLSDLHLTPAQRDKVEWVRSLADLEPDLVVDTGDNMAHLRALPPLLEALGPLTRFPGAFVMGSNDYFSPRMKNPARYLTKDSRGPDGPRIGRPRDLPADDLARELTRAGWVDLDNRRDTITLPDGRLVELVGVDDPHLELDRFPERVTEPDPTSVLRLGVAHAPYRRVLDDMYDDGAELILAGHTHGGQLCVPGLGALVTNCDLDRARAKGVHGWPGARPDTPEGAGSTWLEVCGGLGTNPYTPFRFACRPEAVLLTLTAR
ncbi:putative MPP superfamily phosphohydrolase [Luteimicrobium subarcticum]|uniref:Putative MPP superfamily phosphohydrolase n=1 Tax=Luteimicrobium subarcticum TaxID=620910 RepID=A0A2M8WW63_9MICO|nr:putative MPP superfamily phosphohydrolase [Luteimicrobium subarcticum]